ncbi:hypothetical protein RUM43_007518 [Polyplax serrata]|uniref:Uncharacterized protein n=1 Tax=Polyplax serrata TaxID=468196 RepID=A0AAN8PX88_POLSC
MFFHRLLRERITNESAGAEGNREEQRIKSKIEEKAKRQRRLIMEVKGEGGRQENERKTLERIPGAEERRNSSSYMELLKAKEKNETCRVKNKGNSLNPASP